MTRYIDADAVIDVQMYDEEKEDFYTEKMTVEDFICKYSEMPSIIDEPHWIPCSERLPSDDKDYLVTDGESMAVGYYRTDAKAWDNVNFGWLEHREETCGLKTVVAWMPLPEPYEGDKK